MGLFDIFCNVVAGGATAQDINNRVGFDAQAAYEAADENAKAKRSGWDTGFWAGFAGNAAHITTHRPIDER